MDRERLKLFLEQSGLKYKQNNNSYILDCPTCNHSEKLYIRKSDGRTICWHCASSTGKGKKLEYVLSDLLSVSPEQIEESLSGGIFNPGAKLDFQIKEWGETEERVSTTFEQPEMVFPKHFVRLGDFRYKPALAYLQSRGIDEDLINFYEILYDPRTFRVVFPMYVDGRLIGWHDRYIKRTEYVDIYGVTRKVAKSITNFEKSKCLLFQDKVVSDCVTVCEGPVDALKCRYLQAIGVATFGKNVSLDQLQILINKGVKRIYLGLDPDAFMATKNLVEILSYFEVEIFELRPPEHREDLGACTFEEVQAQFEKAQPVNRAHIFYDFSQ